MDESSTARPHAQKLSGAGSLTSKFNAACGEALLVIGEEVLFSGDRAAANAIKAAITEDTIQLERKGIDPIQIKSYSRYLLCSNEARAAPAETGTERRYFILKVGAQYAGDRDYFDALYREIENGGTEAFLETLLSFDTSRVNLRNPPKTEALAEQVAENLRAEERWWLNVLESGAFTGEDGVELDEPKDWDTRSVSVAREHVFASYNAAVSTYGQRQATESQIGRLLAKFVPDLKTCKPRVGGKRERHYQFPPLPECVAEFERVTGVHLNAAPLAKIATMDVTPSDDLWYEAGRLMEMDATIAMIVGPEEANLVQRYAAVG